MRLPGLLALLAALVAAAHTATVRKDNGAIIDHVLLNHPSSAYYSYSRAFMEAWGPFVCVCVFPPYCCFNGRNGKAGHA